MIHLAAGVSAFVESALGLGVLIPGEAAIVALATRVDGSAAVLMVLAVALGAVVGDHVGFHLGRRSGPRLAASRVVARVGVDRWRRATALVQRYGAPAVALSRVLPVVRTLTPAAAGVGGLPRARFAVASAIGSLCWAALWVGTGSLVGPAVLADLNLLAYVALGAVVLAVAVAGWRWRRRVTGDGADAGSDHCEQERVSLPLS